MDKQNDLLFQVADDLNDLAIASQASQQAGRQALEALIEIYKIWQCPKPKTMADWSARCDVMADYARQAIKQAEGRE